MSGPTGELGRAETRGRGGRPSRQQSAQLADRILDVAETLFLGHGFGATSIEAVAKRAGISKRTFYHRFPGKERLFEAVVRRLIDRWLPPFDTGLLAPPNLADALGGAAEYMLKIALTPEALALHSLVIHEARRFPSLARIMHELGAASGIERIAHHLEPRIKSGELRAIDPHFAAEQFILSVVTGPQRRALGLGVPLSAAEISTHARNAVTLFLEGSRARQGSMP
ncbi:MAG TPA: TetR/AcrR family transcriptional regulator [Stellaceae bacterium]|nr:TetR/AcrR family transcriptional regulator [Stellaceae bacterium]